MMKIHATGLSTCSILLVLAGCTPSEAEHPTQSEYAAESAHEVIAEPLGLPSPEEWHSLQVSVEAYADSVDRLLRRVPNLSTSEQGTLRRDVNAVQIARARQLGISRDADVQQLLASGGLIELEDSTELWVLRDLTHSKPYVTPATHAMLRELGERFQAQLVKHDLPAYRMQITSVLRMPEHQAALRRVNPNASQGVSAHEFGTTVDVAYRRFSPPAERQIPAGEDVHPVVEERLALLHDYLLEETALLRGTEMQALLGRAVLEMRNEGKLMAMMERQQTVYHMTVARR
jgi:hypothetical protein